MIIQILQQKFLFLHSTYQTCNLNILKANLGTLFLWYSGIYKGIIIFMRNFHEFFYIVSMSMNTSVQG